MKYLIFLIFLSLLFGCTNSKSVYWCGDHACINNKEKEAFFKKTMIVEKRELNKQNTKDKSALEIIKKQAGLEDKKRVEDKKEFTKQGYQEEKRRIKLEKELAKQARQEEKRRIKLEKELTKQARLEEKRRIKLEKELTKQARLEGEKTSKKKNIKTKNDPSEKKVVLNTRITTIDITSVEFQELVEKIYKKNKLKPFPNINNIPN